jgi:membrane protein DedA with SNARE-associated domain
VQHVDLFLAHYGYFAIFGLLTLGIVGPWIPDETILVLAGAAVHAGRLSMGPAIAAGVAGSLCGITLSYLLGRTGAVWALEHFGPLKKVVGEHLPKAHAWFERYGKWSLFFGYFVAGIRHFTALAAGTSKLDYPEFAAWAYPGGLLWVTSFVLIGYYVGGEWERIAPYVSRGILVAAAAAALVALAVWSVRKRGAQEPRP